MLTLDTGAETNLIKEQTAIDLGLKVYPSTQFATQADGLSQLNITGETKIVVQRDGKDFVLEALVAQNIDADALAGIPFMVINDIAIRPATREIQLADGTVYHYGPPKSTKTVHSVRRTQSVPVRAQFVATTIWPGEYLEVPYKSTDDCTLALEPRIDTNFNKKSHSFRPPPTVTQSVAGKIRIPNETSLPLTFKRNEHLAQVSPVYSPSKESSNNQQPNKISSSSKSIVDNHTKISLDPDNILPPKIVSSFRSINMEFNEVFDSSFKGYNGAVGPMNFRH